jgi:hypothetical protein
MALKTTTARNNLPDGSGIQNEYASPAEGDPTIKIAEMRLFIKCVSVPVSLVLSFGWFWAGVAVGRDALACNQLPSSVAMDGMIIAAIPIQLISFIFIALLYRSKRRQLAQSSGAYITTTTARQGSSARA